MKYINETTIVPEAGCVLHCTYDNQDYLEASLGYVYYDADGKLLPEPYKLTINDFVEIKNTTHETVNIDGQDYDFIGKSYSEIKTTVIKIRYSIDDQIALILNYQNDPIKYQDSYDKMQSWREYATEIANKYSI